MKKVYGSSEESGAPLSSAVEANGLVFVSGQIHADAEWNLIGDTIEEKLKITVSNIEKILKETGLTLNDIVHVRLYMTDLSELPALNTAYTELFNHPLPARAAIGVTSLPLGASLEIEVIATQK